MSIKEEIKMLSAEKAMTMTELTAGLSAKGSAAAVQSISKKLSKES